MTPGHRGQRSKFGRKQDRYGREYNFFFFFGSTHGTCFFNSTLALYINNKTVLSKSSQVLLNGDFLARPEIYI